MPGGEGGGVGQRVNVVPTVQVQDDSTKQQGRVYAANGDKPMLDTGVITSTLLVGSIPIVILFYSCSTHIFISQTFVPRTGLGLEDLDYDLVVTTPAREVLTIGECVRGVVVATEHHILFTNFKVLAMHDFDAIFRVD